MENLKVSFSKNSCKSGIVGYFISKEVFNEYGEKMNFP